MKERSVCIIGRVNVGKSTLFNRLTKSRDAIVEDVPGITRDRKEGQVRLNNHIFRLIDTGGLDPEFTDQPSLEAQNQTRIAISLADIVIFLVDIRSGLLPGDLEISTELKKLTIPVILVANKVDHETLEFEAHEFLPLGFGIPLSISAEHNIGIETLLLRICELLDRIPDEKKELREEIQNIISVAVVGKPNVGKSTIINALLGQNRLVVSDIPGTTRDAIDTFYRYGDRLYKLIDTAGLRRVGRTIKKVDRISSMIAKRSIEQCDVAVLVMDANEGVTAQDAKIGGYIVEAGRGCIIAANKWDLTQRTEKCYTDLCDQIKRKFVFLDWAPIITISAETKQRVFKLFSIINSIYDRMQHKIPTPQLNKMLQNAQLVHPPPRMKNKRPIKFYYANQINTKPPTFLLFTNTHEPVHFSYERFLMNKLRQEFDLAGLPIKLVFRHKHSERGR